MSSLHQTAEVGRKILIVDDDANVSRLMSYALEVEGYETVAAETGSEGLEAVECERPPWPSWTSGCPT